MRNIRLTIEYDGSGYSGWQVQNHRSKTGLNKSKTIQEIIEDRLHRILREKVRLVASGRTDSGVHALQQVANFKTCRAFPLEKLQKSLNSLLPPDIVILGIKQVSSGFHSRFSAKSKIYRYSILNRKQQTALLRHTYYHYPFKLDINLMRREAAVIKGRHNFAAFQASGSKIQDTRRTVKKIRVAKKGDFIYIEIESDGFLYNMVRNIAGTLVDIGRGRLKKGSMRRILLSKDRRAAGPCLPARGLCLIKVKY
jgi:tRNA pseudouridine38-40 synthase